MAVSYNKLRKKLIDLGMCKGELRVKAGVSTGQLGQLGQLERLGKTKTLVVTFLCECVKCWNAMWMRLWTFLGQPKRNN